MADKGRRDESDAQFPLQGGRLIQHMQRALERLHLAGTERDRAGNRRLFCDQYLSLLLLYFFTPAIKSLRALQNTTNWEKTRLQLGIRRTSLGSLSEASSVFDAELVRPIIAELAVQALPLDRGYASYELLAQIVQAKSSLVARVKDNTAFVPREERPLDEAARQAGVIRDVVISRLGTSHHKNHLHQNLRLVIVRVTNRDGKMTELWLLTDRLDLSADLVALAYRYRWTVELFFRWMQSVLGARHLISKKRNGVTLQMYAAMIVSLLIVLHTNRKPNVRTFETLQFYLLGWVTDDELDAHLASLQKKSC